MDTDSPVEDSVIQRTREILCTDPTLANRIEAEDEARHLGFLDGIRDDRHLPEEHRDLAADDQSGF